VLQVHCATFVQVDICCSTKQLYAEYPPLQNFVHSLVNLALIYSEVSGNCYLLLVVRNQSPASTVCGIKLHCCHLNILRLLLHPNIQVLPPKHPSKKNLVAQMSVCHSELICLLFIPCSLHDSHQWDAYL